MRLRLKLTSTCAKRRLPRRARDQAKQAEANPEPPTPSRSRHGPKRDRCEKARTALIPPPLHTATHLVRYHSSFKSLIPHPSTPPSHLFLEDDHVPPACLVAVSQEPTDADEEGEEELMWDSRTRSWRRADVTFSALAKSLGVGGARKGASSSGDPTSKGLAYSAMGRLSAPSGRNANARGAGGAEGSRLRGGAQGRSGPQSGAGANKNGGGCGDGKYAAGGMVRAKSSTASQNSHSTHDLSNSQSSPVSNLLRQWRHRGAVTAVTSVTPPPPTRTTYASPVAAQVVAYASSQARPLSAPNRRVSGATGHRGSGVRVLGHDQVSKGVATVRGAVDGEDFWLSAGNTMQQSPGAEPVDTP
jgi:hypothetical protein